MGNLEQPHNQSRNQLQTLGQCLENSGEGSCSSIESDYIHTCVASMHTWCNNTLYNILCGKTGRSQVDFKIRYVYMRTT